MRTTFSMLAIVTAMFASICTAAEIEEAQVKKVFDELYGEQLSRVGTTISKDDDIELGELMVSVAKTVDNQPALVVMICKTAHKLTSQVPAGFSVAEDAIDLLLETAPDQRVEWNELLLDLRQLQLKRSSPADRIKAGKALIEVLEASGDDLVKAEKETEASSLYRRAVQVSAKIRSKDAVRLRQKIEQISLNRKARGKIEVLQKRLAADPKDKVAAEELVRILIVEMDQPEKARDYLFVLEGELKRNVELAGEDPSRLQEEDAMRLGQWYHGLADKAPALHRYRMYAHAQALYERFLELHTKPGIRKTAGELRLRRVSDTMVKMESKMDPKKRAVGRTSRTIMYVGRPIAVEAEQAAAVVPTFKFGRDSGASGGTFAYLPPIPGVSPASMREVSKGRIAFFVVARQPATVQLYGRVRSLPGSISSFFVAVVAGKKLDARFRDWVFGGKVNEWQWVRYGAIQLKAGINTIIIAGREAGTGLDAIRIDPSRSDS